MTMARLQTAIMCQITSNTSRLETIPASERNISATGSTIVRCTPCGLTRRIARSQTWRLERILVPKSLWGRSPPWSCASSSSSCVCGFVSARKSCAGRRTAPVRTRAQDRVRSHRTWTSRPAARYPPRPCWRSQCLPQSRIRIYRRVTIRCSPSKVILPDRKSERSNSNFGNLRIAISIALLFVSPVAPASWHAQHHVFR